MNLSNYIICYTNEEFCSTVKLRIGIELWDNVIYEILRITRAAM